jgi:predicted enzyme related to lactoylglutathione lyase
MPQADKHPPGDFCWIELGTTDQDAAKNFYASLFGWTPNDMPMGADGVYTIFRLGGRDSAAACTLTQQERAQHLPPHWSLYIAVENADAAGEKAAQLGGKVLAPAFDVFDVGRMAVVQDPTGAVFIVWQAKKNAGIGIVREPGAFCWEDLSTPDPERAKQFYSGLFGWHVEAGEKDQSGYLHIKNGENFIGGIPPVQHRDPTIPPHWLIYFSVADVDGLAAKAKQMGARFYVEPMSIEGVGRLAVMADPQGAVSAIFKESPRG